MTQPFQNNKLHTNIEGGVFKPTMIMCILLLFHESGHSVGHFHIIHK